MHSYQPSYVEECKAFALKAFDLGKNLFAALHKPYRPSNFQEAAEEWPNWLYDNNNHLIKKWRNRGKGYILLKGLGKD